MAEPAYSTAQVCENGHVVNPSLEIFSARTEVFCSKCGAKTITACPSCSKRIRGPSDYDSVVVYARPAYCADCGKPHPWTTAAIGAAKEFAIEAELSEMDRNELPDIIENLVRDTPRSSVAAARLRRIFEKTKPWAVEGFKTILIEVVTEGAKKVIWPVP